MGLTFAPGGKTVTLALQKPQTIDANGDHTDDIQATLSAITDKKATIAFRNAANITKAPQADTQGNRGSGGTLSGWVIGVGALAVLLAYWLLRRHYRSKA